MTGPTGPTAREAFRIARPKARKLARQGRLIDETFKAFQRAVYPGAPPDQVAALRTCFYAGAQELFVMMMTGFDEEEGETAEDLEFIGHVSAELEQFHERTMRAAKAATDGRTQ